MSTTLARPQLLPPPRPRPAGRRQGVVLVAAGLALCSLGLVHLVREITRQSVLEPLARGGWELAVVAEGVGPVATRVEEAAQRVGDADALRAGAGILAALSGATESPEAVGDLRRRALVLAEASLELAPGMGRSHLLAGAALVDLGSSPQQASWHLARAAALDPHAAGLRRHLGLIALTRGLEEEAAANLQASLAADPAPAETLFATISRFPTALTPADITPRTTRAQVALGTWLGGTGDAAGARAAFETALALADATTGTRAREDESFWAYRRFQGHLLSHGKLADVESLATRRLDSGRFTSPAQEAEIVYHRGLANLRRERYDNALIDLRRALRLAPGRNHHANAVATTLAKMGQHAEAADAWRLALSLTRINNDRAALFRNSMRLQRARSLAATGEKTQAMHEIRRVLMNDPENEPARRLLDEMVYE